MKMTAKDVAELVGGEVVGDANIVVTGAAGLDEAGPQDVSFVGNQKYTSQTTTTRAGIVLLKDPVVLTGKTVIVVKNPQLAYAKVLRCIEKELRPGFEPGIHPTAVIHKKAQVAQDIAIGPYVVIEEGTVIGGKTTIQAHSYIGKQTVIGEECFIYPQVTIRESITIGNRVVIHPGVVIGADGFGFSPTHDGFFKIPQIGTVIVGDDVEIGANVTIDRATTDATRIGKGTKIDNLVQIGHNVQIGEHVIIAAAAAIAGSAKIGSWATIAGQAGIVGHVSIGDGAVIAGQAGVIGDVKAGEVVSGYPARNHRVAMRTNALINRLPLFFEEIKKLRRELLKK